MFRPPIASAQDEETSLSLAGYRALVAEAVRRLTPQDAAAYINRGYIYFVKLGNKEKGCSDFKQACEFGECENYNLVKRKGDCE